MWNTPWKWFHSHISGHGTEKLLLKLTTESQNLSFPHYVARCSTFKTYYWNQEKQKMNSSLCLTHPHLSVTQLNK